MTSRKFTRTERFSRMPCTCDVLVQEGAPRAVAVAMLFIQLRYVESHVAASVASASELQMDSVGGQLPHRVPDFDEQDAVSYSKLSNPFESLTKLRATRSRRVLVADPARTAMLRILNRRFVEVTDCRFSLRLP